MSTSTKNSKTIPGIEKGWFTELEAIWPGQRFSLALEEFSSDKSVLFYEDSGFQKILVFRSAQYGNVLVLDGVIQLTERDEFAFHEMMVHLPLCSHPNPRSVCIVGGGDGHVLRQVCRHSGLERITVVEIDPMMVTIAKKYFDMTNVFDDPRVEIVQEDGAKYIGRCQQEFDIIISDSNDPIGPAESLFEPAFYEKMYNALKDGGIVCAFSESFWIHLDLISDLVACSSEIFEHAEYATTMVPTYPCGQIGFILAGKKTGRGTCRIPQRIPDFLGELRWYNPQIHKAAFVLPTFVEKRLDQWSIIDDEGHDPQVDRCFLDKCRIL